MRYLSGITVIVLLWGCSTVMTCLPVAAGGGAGGVALCMADEARKDKR